MAASVTIRNLTRRPTPGLPFDRIASALLPGWEVSLVFVGTTRAKRFNMQLRGKTYTPNVLSYEVGTRSGEIIICPEVATKQAPSYSLSPRAFVGLLFIHGLLHLKGHQHGTRMERYERTMLARYVGGGSERIHETTHRNRDRYRDAPGEGRRRRRSR